MRANKMEDTGASKSHRERLFLAETTELLEKLNGNLDEIRKFGYEVTVKVTPSDTNSSRSFKRPLIEIELNNHLANQV